MELNKIKIKGARENNLKNIDIEIPRNKLVIMTGVSGSGKTSLAFDTIYAEGQRRYVESLSAYARQFLGGIEKPDVDSIEGLSPSISIDQKTTSNNPRSTVGTATEIYDYLRLMYARVGTPYCPNHNTKIEALSVKQMVDQIMSMEHDARLMIKAPIIKRRKGSHKELLASLLKDGYVRAVIDNEMFLLEDAIELDKNKNHDISVVVDRIILREDNRSRLSDSINAALSLTDGTVEVSHGDHNHLFSANFACDQCGFSIPKLEPRLFSFNSPLGACDACNGIGSSQTLDIELLIPDMDLSIVDGGIIYYKNMVNSDNIEWKTFESLCNYYNIDLEKPLGKMTKKEMDIILNGSKEPIPREIISRTGNIRIMNDYIEGVKSLIERRFMETSSESSRRWYQSFLSEQTCEVCEGRRLNEMALAVRIDHKNIFEWTSQSIADAYDFMQNINLDANQQQIADLVIKEISDRLRFLRDVVLDYLTMERVAGTLSGGEAQRIRLATQIGSSLMGVLYVLDEPSIGLHQRDNDKLINTLKSMRDLGNSVLVVEHDEDTMLASDWIIDVGPGAGVHGGNIMAAGTPAQIMKNKNSLTGKFLSGKETIPTPKERRKGNGLFLNIKGATENNLKNISVDIPLGMFNVVSGVSGSGKSSLVNEVLTKSILKELRRTRIKPGKVKSIEGLENIDKVVNIDQNPIGRTPRSNPATYTGVFDHIRDLFALSTESKLRGYSKGRFSFNVAGGRCEKCRGDGVKKISMHFLPDVYVKCEECDGKRYNDDTLQVTFKGKNIYDILEMTVEDAVVFFDSIAPIKHSMQILEDVGLGYIKLGQSSTTLSGGEAQRVKLASELQKRATGKTLFVLDEPTTGLHSYDVRKLLTVLQRIVDNGDTVLVIEHNLDIIKNADYILDLGPEGGSNGGTIIAQGTPEEVAQVKASYTGKYLKKVLEKGQ
ncbi:MAG: excinuclease ABC subunit UvrA [Erysipelothrix sp.]|nr:excinuclease ABC subunit UvrA [Erysipelothrix sp.]